jgi:hypothetical protein
MTDDNFWHEIRVWETYTNYTRRSLVGSFHVQVTTDGRVEMNTPSGYTTKFSSLDEAKQDIIDRGF